MGTPKLVCPKLVYQCRKQPVSTSAQCTLRGGHGQDKEQNLVKQGINLDQEGTKNIGFPVVC